MIKQQIYDDEITRIEIEGKFGNCKRKGTLGRIMAKLADTGEAVIGIGLIMVNLDKALREVLCWLYFWLVKAGRNIFVSLTGRAESGWSAKSSNAPPFSLLIRGYVGPREIGGAAAI